MSLSKISRFMIYLSAEFWSILGKHNIFINEKTSHQHTFSNEKVSIFNIFSNEIFCILG